MKAKSNITNNFDLISQDAFSNANDAPAAETGSGGDSGGGGKVSQDTINAGIEAGTTLVGLFANRQKNQAKQTVKAACGHKPFCIATANCRAKKAAYQKCAQNIITPPVDNSRMYQAPQSNTGLIIGISIGAVLLAVVGIVVVKQMNKPVVVAPNIIAQ